MKYNLNTKYILLNIHVHVNQEHVCTLSRTYAHSSKNICAHFIFSSNSLEHMSNLPKHMCILYIGHGLHFYQRCSIPEITKQLLFILLETTSKHILIIKTYMHTSFVDFISPSKHICTSFH